MSKSVTKETVVVAALRWYAAKNSPRSEQIRAEAGLIAAIEGLHRQSPEQPLPPA
jgi:hypothetical protein